MSGFTYDRPDLPGRDDPETLTTGRDFFRGVDECADSDSGAGSGVVEVEFGTLEDGFWGPYDGGEQTFPVSMVAGETLFFVHVIPAPGGGDDWDADPPFTFPEGWENAIDSEDPFVGVETLVVPDAGTFLAIPYIYTGSDVLAEVTIDVRGGETFAYVYIFGITIPEGATIADWLGAGLFDADEDDPVTVAGTAEADGKRIALSLRVVENVGIS